MSIFVIWWNTPANQLKGGLGYTFRLQAMTTRTPLLWTHGGRRVWRAELFWLHNNQEAEEWDKKGPERSSVLQSHVTSDLLFLSRLPLHYDFHHHHIMLSNYEAIIGLVHWLGQQHHDPITFPCEPVGQTFHFQTLTPVFWLFVFQGCPVSSLLHAWNYLSVQRPCAFLLLCRFSFPEALGYIILAPYLKMIS